MKGLKNKTGFLVFVLLMLVLATMLGFLLTQGRYSEELQSGSDMYDSELEYIVADQVEVNSVEEFIAAVENGYSNITIADGVDNPLIITSGITDVGADLIIDLNGHEIQRNNREPMLNIIEGVRVTVIDSSTSQTGSFYNPVGSVLQIDGGTLTVTAGTFTSGPRSEEYAGTGTYKSVSGGHMENTASLTVRVKSGSGYTESTVAAPIILPSVKEETDGITTRYFVNGNMYFDEAWTAPASDPYLSGLIKSDTYFYFVIDDDTVSNTSIAASENSADFYYTYNVRREEGANGDVSYSYTESEEGDNVVPVTVYGYHNVKGSANPEGSDTTPDYATVKMMSGNMYTRGGAYESLFGEKNTYGIYASGGYMAVNAGAFSAKEAATCVACAYGADASSSEFLQVTGGSFSSEYGDTVSVSGGNMVLTGGNFTLDASRALEGMDSAAVSVMGGTLNASNASGLEFDITANALDTSVTYGIMVNDGTADIRNAAFTFAGAGDDYTYTYTGTGVRGVSVSGGSATLIDTDFTFGGTGSTYTDAIGISAEGGSIKATNVDISINSSIVSGTPGNANRGIYSDGGTVWLYGDCTINIAGTYSAGILAVTDSSSQADGKTKSIIYGEEKESAGTLTVNVTGTADNNVLSSTAMSTEGGSINIANGNVSITSDGLGVTTRSGGGITFSGEEFNVKTTNGTGIYVNGGDITFEKGTVTVNANVDGLYTWSGVPNESGGYDDNGVVFYDGIVVQGGSLKANSDTTLNVTLTNENENENGKITNTYDGDYDDLNVKSYAVRVVGNENTNVSISQGTIINEDSGGGLYVSGVSPSGNENDNFTKVTMGDSASSQLTIRSRGTGTDETRYYDVEGKGDEWDYRRSTTGGHAVEIVGGQLTLNGGTYTAAMGNGILVSGGEAIVNAGTFSGNDSYESNAGQPAIAGAAASYGMKMYGGTLNVYGGTFGEADSVGSGAFIMGMSSDAKAIANIIGGTFDVKGTAGVSVYENANVTFGTEGSTSGPTVMGGAAGMTVEVVTDANNASTINIYGGSFSGSDPDHAHNDGIWYGAEFVQTGLFPWSGEYRNETELNIHGGTFTTANSNGRAGLTIESNGENVNLSGGTFRGNNSYPFSGSRATVGDVLGTGFNMYYDEETNAISTNTSIGNLSRDRTVVVK